MKINKYQNKGEYTHSFYRIQSSDKKIGEYHIHYPSQLKSSEEKYPVIIAANGVIEPSKIYYHALKHLATWGFIVVSNQDNNSWSGYSTMANLKLILSLNEDELSPFYHKVDIDNIGLLGHSEGGIAAINAINNFEEGKYFKTLYTASMPNICLASLMGWKYDLKKIKVPFCMMQGTGWSDSCFFIPKVFAMNNYKQVLDTTPKIEARCKKATHNETLWDNFAAYTAWFMYQLKNDENAKDYFCGENAVILSDDCWKDVKKNF